MAIYYDVLKADDISSSEGRLRTGSMPSIHLVTNDSNRGESLARDKRDEMPARCKLREKSSLTCRQLLSAREGGSQLLSGREGGSILEDDWSLMRTSVGLFTESEIMNMMKGYNSDDLKATEDNPMVSKHLESV